MAGAYLVIMPNNQKKNGISKKADAAERQRTKEILSQLSIPDSLSIIVRTEGLNRTKEELAWDLDCLLHHWNNIHNATKGLAAPALIHQEGDAVIRSVRDRLRKNIDEIIIDHEPTLRNYKPIFSKQDLSLRTESSYMKTKFLFLATTVFRGKFSQCLPER